MLQDLRLAVRTLRKSPAYTFVAVAALALGIGANVAIFSTVYAVLLAPLPFPSPDRLVVPVSTNVSRAFDRVSVSYADFEDYARERDVFAAIAVFSPLTIDATGTGQQPERVEAARVSDAFFIVLGTTPLVGRTIGAADTTADAERVAVLSHGFWQRRFGGDPAVLTRELRIAGVTVRITGVLPEGGGYPAVTDVWLPLQTSIYQGDDLTRRDNFIFQSVARLAPGVPLEQAQARVQAIAARVAREFSASRARWSADVIPLRQYIVESDLRQALLVLFAAVGVVLLIVCVNIANLLLARGTVRGREMAIRLAIGAGRARLVRQLVTENLVLAVAGGSCGLLIAFWMIRGLLLVAPAGVPFADRIELSGAALAASVAITLVSVIAFGMVPALAASRTQPVAALRESSATESVRAGRLRDALVITQIALASVLLVTAGLLIRSFAQLSNVDPGADVERVMAGRVSLPAARYPTPADRARFYARLTEALAARPGVAAAAATSLLPVGGPGFGLGRVFLAEGRPEPPAGTDVGAMWNVITPEYFRTVGIPLLRGRTFDARDVSGSTPVIIVSQTFATRMYGTENPLGRRVRSWRDENLLRQIVGIVADVRLDGLSDDNSALVYVPHQQQGWSGMVVAARAAGDPTSLAGVLREEVGRLDADLALGEVGTMASFAQASIARERFSTMLLAAFAGTALILAAIGIYGVMAYAVVRRTRELGVHSAMGATPRQLASLVLGRGLVLTAWGALAGLVGSLATVQAVEGLLFGTSATDPATFVAAPAVLALVAMLACYIPARKAAGADPLVALRAE